MDEAAFWAKWGTASEPRPARKRGSRDGLCAKCAVAPKNVGDPSYCIRCRREKTAESMRRTRRRHSELSEEDRLKANCRAYTNVLISRGKLVRGPCACGSTLNVEAHHEDYSKPREVVWKCRVCHRGEHREQRSR